MAASFHQRFYPEIGAGGFSRIDGTVAFYNRVNALLKKEAVVLDYGAGRGFGHVEDPCEYRRSLCNFRSRIASVIGVDVDEAVMQNPALDEAYVFNPKDPLPIGDASIDIIVSEFIAMGTSRSRTVSCLKQSKRECSTSCSPRGKKKTCSPPYI